MGGIWDWSDEQIRDSIRILLENDLWCFKYSSGLKEVEPLVGELTGYVGKGSWFISIFRQYENYGFTTLYRVLVFWPPLIHSGLEICFPQVNSNAVLTL